MSKARNEILARIRQSTRRMHSSAESETIVSQRLARHTRGSLPALEENSLQTFIKRAEKAAASVITINHRNELAATIGNYLAEHGLAQKIVAAPSPLLDNIAWPEGYEIARRIARASDKVALSAAFAGIAETGTLALLSGQATPTTLNFLPDNYICLLRESDLLTHMEEVWDRIRNEAGGMPRTLNFITGPSRTADVEQTIQLGAHGPRRLLVIIEREKTD